MQEISLKDINISALQKITGHGSNLATIYTDGENCYKIYNNPYAFDNRGLYENYKDMEGIQIEGLILPNNLIVDDNLLRGYIMPYFKDSMTLSDRFCGRFIDKKLLIRAFNKASAIIRQMHKVGIVCQDLSAENILINSNGDVAICDSDSFAYKKYYSESFSKLFIIFLMKYRNTKLEIWEDIDTISMFITFYYLLFEKEIQTVSDRQYSKLSKEMKSVDNMKEIKELLLDKKRPLKNIPYIDEFTSSEDTGTLDKDKYLTIGQKIYHKMDRIIDRIIV